MIILSSSFFVQTHGIGVGLNMFNVVGCSLVIGRLLRHISAYHTIDEVGEDQYKMTPLSESLAKKEKLNTFSYL